MTEDYSCWFKDYSGRIPVQRSAVDVSALGDTEPSSGCRTAGSSAARDGQGFIAQVVWVALA